MKISAYGYSSIQRYSLGSRDWCADDDDDEETSCCSSSNYCSYTYREEPRRHRFIKNGTGLSNWSMRTCEPWKGLLCCSTGRRGGAPLKSLRWPWESGLWLDLSEGLKLQNKGCDSFKEESNWILETWRREGKSVDDEFHNLKTAQEKNK